LKGQLDIDREAAHAELKATPLDFGFNLRPCQKRAIQEVEKALEADRRQMLLAWRPGPAKQSSPLRCFIAFLPPSGSAGFVSWWTAAHWGSRPRRNSVRPRW
jgi:hypothetical protein